MLEAAVKYYELGLSIIPVGPDKVPLNAWKRYQTTRATPEEIKTWFRQWPDMNIGIVTGAISGIAVIDVENGGDASVYPPTATVKTANGGWHLYYKHPGEQIKNGVRVRELTDIRGDRGMVVAPPSVLTGGKSYEWVVPFEDGLADYPIMPEKSALAAKTTVAVSEIVAEGSRNDAATKEIGRILHTLSTRDWETYGWAGLREWNRTHCVPPLDETELRTTHQSIASRETANRLQSDEVVDEATIAARFTPITLSQLYEKKFPKAHWAVDGLIPLGGITAFTGSHGSFKTFITQHMAMAVATGELFLGHFPTKKGVVLIVDEENPLAYTQDRFNKLEAPAGAKILFLSQIGMRADNETDVARLRAVIEKENPVLIILDSLIDLHSKDENDAAQMTPVITALRSLVNNERAVVVIHHHRKVQGGKAKASQDIRGSSGIAAAVDAHIAVDRKYNTDDVTISQEKLRVQKQMAPFDVSVVDEENGKVSFVYQGVNRDRDEKIEHERNIIVAFIGTSATPQTINEIIAGTKLSESTIRSVTKRLVENGDLGREKHAHGQQAFFIPQSEGDPAQKMGLLGAEQQNQISQNDTSI